MNSEEAVTTQNLYATHLADLAVAPDASDIQVFERSSTWAVFGLVVVTVWFYGYYWLYTRAKTLNTVVENKISDSFIFITIWGSEQGGKTFCGGVGTFFLSAIHFQHKINRSIDLAETTAA